MCFDSRLTLQLVFFRNFMARLYIEISGDTLKSKIKFFCFINGYTFAVHAGSRLKP